MGWRDEVELVFGREVFFFLLLFLSFGFKVFFGWGEVRFVGFEVFVKGYVFYYV